MKGVTVSLYKQYGTNTELEGLGVWMEIGVNEDGTVPAMKIARSNNSNKAYKKAIRKALAPHSKALQLGTMNEALAESIMLSAFAKHCVKDWRHIVGEKGEVLEYSHENVIKLLTDLPELYEDLTKKAENAGLFKDENLEADSKN